VLISTKHFGLRGSKKLHPPFVGPFTVLKLVGPNAVHLHMTPPFEKRHPTFPVSLLKVYKHAPKNLFGDRRIAPPPPPALVRDGEAEWEIEKILDRASFPSSLGNVEKYKVRWRGFDASEDSWLDHTQLENALDLVQDYDQANPRINRKDGERPSTSPKAAKPSKRHPGRSAITQAKTIANDLPRIVLGNPL
jgi:hypothetical protein